MEKVNDCSRCRHHSKQQRAKPTGWQEGAHFELADETQTVYRCGAPEGPWAGKEVGLDPVTCESFSAGAANPVSPEVQSAYDAFMARQARRQDRE